MRPGAQELTETGPDQYDAVLKVGVAAIRGTYKGKVAIADKEEPTSYTLLIEGSGGPGWLKGARRSRWPKMVRTPTSKSTATARLAA